MMRKTVAAALAAVALAVAVYGGYWWVAADRLKKGLDAWAAERRARGWTVELGAVSVGGFPGRLALAIERPRLGAPAGAGGWVWQGPEVVATARPWSLARIEVAAPGVHRVSPAPGMSPLRIVAGRADGVVEGIETGRPRRIAASLEAVSIEGVDGGPRRTVDSLDLTIALPAAPGRADLSTGAAPEPDGPFVTLRVAGLDLVAAPLPALGSRIETLALDFKLIGPLPPGPIARTLAVWRDGGGTLEIRRLEIQWNRLAVKAEGTLALDSDMQPIAALKAEIRGYGPMIDALVQAGAIKAENALAVRIALQLLGSATSGSAGRIAVPVTIQDRELTVGPVKATTLPRIDWQRVAR